ACRNPPFRPPATLRSDRAAAVPETEVGRDLRRRRAGRRHRRPPPRHPPGGSLVAPGIAARRLPGEPLDGTEARAGPRPRRQDPRLGTVGTAATAAAGDALGLARDERLDVRSPGRGGGRGSEGWEGTGRGGGMRKRWAG